jgi:hypothetical protein
MNSNSNLPPGVGVFNEHINPDDHDYLEDFMVIYTKQLGIALQEHPDEYAYGAVELPKVLEWMRAAIIKGSFNKDSRAIKATCRALGIKHTYKAIGEFIQADWRAE